MSQIYKAPEGKNAMSQQVQQTEFISWEPTGKRPVSQNLKIHKNCERVKVRDGNYEAVVRHFW